MDSEEKPQRVLVPVCRVLKMLVFTLLLGSSHAEDFQVIGSPQMIVAVVGDDVILPCQVVPEKDMTRFTVEWSKPDVRLHLQDRLSPLELVHLYRNSREVQEMELQSYIQRTALFADGLRRGNISLKISNVTLEDKGRYKCLIPKLNSVRPYSIIHLDVVAESAGACCPDFSHQTVRCRHRSSRLISRQKKPRINFSRCYGVLINSN